VLLGEWMVLPELTNGPIYHEPQGESCLLFASSYFSV
jgi:hypothetical protein